MVQSSSDSDEISTQLDPLFFDTTSAVWGTDDTTERRKNIFQTK